MEAGSPQPQSSDSALSAPGGSPCLHSKNKVLEPFLLGRAWNVKAPILVSVGCGPAPGSSCFCGGLGDRSLMSFGFIDPGHGPGNKTVSPRGMLWKIYWQQLCPQNQVAGSASAAALMGAVPRSVEVGSGVVFKSCFYPNCSDIFIQPSWD